MAVPFVPEIERDLNPIYRDESRKLKHSLINVFAGILLLLKERLRRIHPNRIYSDVGKRPKPGSNTLNVDEILSRIDVWVDLKFDLSRYLKLLRRAQRVRNELEHHEFSAHKGVLTTLIPKLVEFAYLFAVKELDHDIRYELSFETRDKLDALKAVADHLTEIERAQRRAVRQRYAALTQQELEELADVEPYHPQAQPRSARAVLVPGVRRADLSHRARGRRGRVHECQLPQRGRA